MKIHKSDELLKKEIVIHWTSAETISHHHMRRSGFQEDIKWKSSSSKIFPFSNNSINQGFLQRFQSSTMFLKISCDGDFLLPIVVGSYTKPIPALLLVYFISDLIFGQTMSVFL